MAEKQSKNPDKPWKPAIPKPPGWKPEHPLPRCQGWSRTKGAQCERKRDLAAPGLTLCHMHGAKAPQVRRNAWVNHIMATVEAELVDIPPLDNPWDKAAIHGARVFARSEILHQRVGDIRTVDVTSPEYAALERADTQTRDYLTSLAKLDIDARRVRVSEVQREQVGKATAHALDQTLAWLKQQLPPTLHPLLPQAREQFIQDLRTHLETGKPRDLPSPR